MFLNSSAGLAQLLEEQAEFKRRKAGMSELRENVREEIVQTIEFFEFTAEDLKLASSKLPIKYFDGKRISWTGRGSVPKKFREAHEEQQMHQYEISDEDAQEVANRLQRGVISRTKKAYKSSVPDASPEA